MALGMTNISTTLARNAIGETNNSIGLLCTSSNINQWSLHKPADYGAGNDAWTVDLGSETGYKKPIGISSNTTGHRLGDFRGYDHAAKPPRYFNGNISASYYKYETPNFAIVVKKGTLPPTSNNNAFAPIYQDLDFGNAAHDTGTSVKLEIGGADYGVEQEIKPSTGDISILCNKTAGTYSLKSFYWTRPDEVSNWTKDNEIEGGGVTLTVTELGAKFTIVSRSISPSEVYTGTDHTTENFTYSYSIKNNTSNPLSLGLYWHLGNVSGTVNITVAANATENKTITISSATVYTPSEEFTLRYSTSSGDLIDNSNAIVTVTVA